MNRIYRVFLDPLGLTYAQYLVVLALAETKETTVKELGATLGLDSGTLTPLLKRLEKTGTVTRRRNPDDERQTLVGLSETGRELLGKLAHIPQCVLDETGLSVAEAVHLRDRLHDFSSDDTSHSSIPD